jgi:hypothetical protein
MATTATKALIALVMGSLTSLWAETVGINYGIKVGKMV